MNYPIVTRRTLCDAKWLEWVAPILRHFTQLTFFDSDCSANDRIVHQFASIFCLQSFANQSLVESYSAIQCDSNGITFILPKNAHISFRKAKAFSESSTIRIFNRPRRIGDINERFKRLSCTSLSCASIDTCYIDWLVLINFYWSIRTRCFQSQNAREKFLFFVDLTGLAASRIDSGSLKSSRPSGFI